MTSRKRRVNKVDIKSAFKKLGVQIENKKLHKAATVLGIAQIIIGVLAVCIFEELVWDVIGWIFVCLGIAAILAGAAAWALMRKATRGYIFVPETKLLVLSGPAETSRKKRLDARIAAKDKIDVVFYCDGGSIWNCMDAVYLRMKNDERFNVRILAAPEMFHNKIEHYEAIEFLDEKGYDYIKGYDEKTGRWLDINKLDADYIFYNRHYRIRQPKSMIFLRARKNAKICYIPYATCTAKGAIERTVCGFHTMKAFDYLFSENEEMTKVYSKYKSEHKDAVTKIETLGSTKYDELINRYERIEVPESKYTQRVLYTPRWRLSEGTCSMMDMFEYFFQLVEKHPDIEYIFRPHPLMEQNMGQDWGQENWDAYIARFDDYENARVDTESDYLKTFAESTVLVSDISSMMYEYILTGKPIVHIHKMDTFNDLGNKIARGFYYSKSADEVDAYLEMLREGKDPRKALREEIVLKEYGMADGNTAERIMNCILEDAGKI